MLDYADVILPIEPLIGMVDTTIDIALCSMRQGRSKLPMKVATFPCKPKVVQQHWLVSYGRCSFRFTYVIDWQSTYLQHGRMAAC